MRAAKDPLEDLRELEYERAEERLRSQFKMEKIVYSEDGIYSRQLEAAKSTPNGNPFGKAINANIREMTHHLKAYFTVCASFLVFLCTCIYFPYVWLCLFTSDLVMCPQITSDRLANQVPLILLYHMMEQYLVNVKTAMLGMIRHKDAGSFIQEKSDIAKKREYLLKRMERLRKARQVLAKSVPSA